jgi:hypothetical protein
MARRMSPQPSAVAEAIARHKAAQAAHDAAPDDSDETMDPLFDAATRALEELGKTPCASDAEFIEKLRYLLPQETRQSGALHFGLEYGSILVAVATHLGELGGDA